MLWLCIILPRLPLEALGCDETGAAASRATIVTASEGSTRWIVCCNPAAEQAGLKRAMNYTVALAIHPSASALERLPQAEQAALERLAAWAYQFSSTVIPGEVPQQLRLACQGAYEGMLWLEIGASMKLFGGFRHLIERLERELVALNYTYRLGVAPTLEGAALLARAGIRLAITTPQALRLRIRNLSITELALAPGIAQQLHTAGVRTIGMLLELPRAALSKRFGPQLCGLLDRLTGATPDPRPVFRLPDKYEAHFEFELETASTEALLFPLRRALRELAGFLRARDACVQQFTITLSHRSFPATQLRIGLSAPERDAERFFVLVRERLESTELPAATTAVRLRADRFVEPTALQPDLLSGTRPQHEELAHTIDRITARLGEDRMHGLQPLAEHRPELAWARTAPDAQARMQAGKVRVADLQASAGEGTIGADSSPGAWLDSPQRPLWLLPEPRPLQDCALPAIAAGPQGMPERIEAGWWDGRDVRRDYYVVRTSNGADLWVFQDLDNGSWHLHGFWS